VVVAKDWDAVSALGIAYWERAIEIDTAVVEGPGQRDRVGMERRDDVGAWRKVLGANRL